MTALSPLSYAAQRRINRLVWRPLQQLGQVVHPLPVLAAFLIFLLLAQVGQLHEIYLSYLEGSPDLGRVLHIAFGVSALALTSIALFYSNYALSTIRIDIIYSQTANYTTDVRLKLLRNAVGWLCALAPWAGLTVGLSTAAGRASNHIDRLAEVLGPFLDRLDGMRFQLEASAELPARMQLAAALVALLGPALIYVLHRHRQSGRARVVEASLCAAGILLVLVLPSALVSALAGRSSNAHLAELVAYHRFLGPFAVLMVAILSVVATLAVLAFLSGQIGFPLLSLAFAGGIVAAVLNWPMQRVLWSALTVFATITVLAALSRRRYLAALSALLAAFTYSVAGQRAGHLVANVAEAQSGATRPTLADAFASWLAAREAEREEYTQTRGRPYPVFIVAAQGGGIYAAAAAAAFLSRLQDRCPGFARHVFAISGVSGGAIGSAVFQSLMQTHASRARGCAEESNSDESLTARTSAIMRDDHLSPLLGMLVADWVGLQDDRAAALERSFVASAMRYGASALGEPFDGHWYASGAAPALLLNATWVETGYRVAFSPFTLGGLRDGTLYTFGDAALGIGPAADVSLAGAAVVSARFPGIVPAFTFARPSTKGGAESWVRWNFVDGGYADDSGSATALEIYKVLEPVAEREGRTREKGKIDLRVILLTSSRPALKVEEVQGTVARDVLAPPQTVLRVRGLLSRQAVMRTLSEIEKDPGRRLALLEKRGAAQVGQEDGWSVTLVELDQESFKLALGWKISNTTHNLVSLMIGDGNLCTDMVKHHLDASAVAEAGPDLNGAPRHKLNISARTIRANSCVMHAIAKLVSLGS